MPRPPVEVADLVRAAGERFIETSRSWLSGQHLKVLSAISCCRTAELGGHFDECSDCSHQTAISYNSCRNRHCPKCQAGTRKRWLEDRRSELLPGGSHSITVAGSTRRRRTSSYLSRSSPRSFAVSSSTVSTKPSPKASSASTGASRRSINRATSRPLCGRSTATSGWSKYGRPSEGRGRLWST